MKKLEELGISPAPWTDKDKCEHWIEAKDGFLVANGLEYSDPNCEEQNAKLIAAAPELYRCLREAVVENCHNCGNLENEISAYQDNFVCHNDECFVKRWRTALAKAAGEEVADGK